MHIMRFENKFELGTNYKRQKKINKRKTNGKKRGKGIWWMKTCLALYLEKSGRCSPPARWRRCCSFFRQTDEEETQTRVVQFFCRVRVVTDLTGINQKQLNAYWLLILIRNDEGEEREGRCGRRGSRSCRREREDLPGADR